MTKPVILKATQKIGSPITGHNRFTMVELAALEGLTGLIQQAPKAAELIVCLIRQMQPGSGGVVVGVSSRNGKNRTLSACHVGATVS